MIGHTFEASTGTSFIGAEGLPLPVDLLSAATPALRFIGFLGCHAEGILDQYQVQYELGKIPWKLSVFNSTDALLGTQSNVLGIKLPNVENRLREVAQRVATLDYADGQLHPLNAERDSELRIEVKDVVAGFEPRYVRYNGVLIGMLGANSDTSNTRKEWKELSYAIPSWATGNHSRPAKISIEPVDLSTSGIADDYMIRKVKIMGPAAFALSKEYDPPLHIGVLPGSCLDSSTLPEPQIPVELLPGHEGEIPELSTQIPEKYKQAFIDHVQWAVGAEREDQWRKLKPQIIQDLNEESLTYVRSQSCLDPDALQWSSLTSRVYTDQIH